MFPMLRFSPFAAWRYDLSQVGDLSDVIAPSVLPVTEEYQELLYQRHPCNAIRLIQNREEPGDLSADDHRMRADDFFRVWKKEGILVHEHEAAFYVCAQTRSPQEAGFDSISIIGRLHLPTEQDAGNLSNPDTVIALEADPEYVAECAALMQVTGSQFVPMHGLVSDPAGGDAHQRVFREVQAAVHGLTPLQVTGDDGVIHRLWPLTDRDAVARVQQNLSACQVTVVSGGEMLQAAGTVVLKDASDAAKLNEFRMPSVMTCLTSCSDPGLISMPIVVPVPVDAGYAAVDTGWGSATDSPGSPADRLSSGFVLEAVGMEPSAADDACQLAALNEQQPAIAIGIRGQGWFVIVDRKADAAHRRLAAEVRERHRLARSICSVLGSVSGDAASRAGDGRMQFMRSGRQAAELLDTGTYSAVLLIPAVSGERIVTDGAGTDGAATEGAVVERLPQGSFRLFPAPAVGLVYDSL